MSVRLRLSRHHLTRNAPSYSLVATRRSLRPNARPLEVLGTWTPIPVAVPTQSHSPNGETRDPKLWGPPLQLPSFSSPSPNKPTTCVESVQAATVAAGEKRVVWNEHRVKYWLGQGAKPTKAAEKLLVKAGILDMAVLPQVNAGTRTISNDRRIRDAVRKAGLLPSQHLGSKQAPPTSSA
ncbi:hypothetical protein MVLG_05371 [Microbotryum lychnidis-dioicae p1A1 Lamole]|uniref:Ribosomal protein S16 n=1 Tax=Microbotryum lychnidis-dioicae (strain p1A1 Lamole / MvSl-1064) TaxID=683840 RepID=U5HE21_USTV1|nr:hypothetical protein MVLG_05371 [Microbotryum lychnidis-dioicae p1A1 Lamole]|eukprot:KDE04212.1 hypothetical protein MVLG_05371 [Microbotryum lychnidis-dioicae p1A1 Lamole]